MKQYTHAHFILRCIEIARNGGQKVSPNPMVGSLLVENNEIIGEGFHAEYGKAHADIVKRKFLFYSTYTTNTKTEALWYMLLGMIMKTTNGFSSSMKITSTGLT